MARPPLGLDIEQLSKLLRLYPSKADAAAFFKCSEDTLERRIKEYTVTEENPAGMTFKEFREYCMANTRISLVQKALHKALEKGDNVMLIFCLKNINKWKDRFDGEDKPNQILNINTLTDAELEARISKLSGKKKDEPSGDA